MCGNSRHFTSLPRLKRNEQVGHFLYCIFLPAAFLSNTPISIILLFPGPRLLRPLPGPLQTEPETETEQGEEGRRRP